MSEPLGALRQVIVPVADVVQAAEAIAAQLGLELRFRDGDRWAAFDAGGLTLALAGPGEQPAGGGIALGVKVADLDAALERVAAEGGEVLEDVREGEHERRATCRDRFGATLALYQSLG